MHHVNMNSKHIDAVLMRTGLDLLSNPFVVTPLLGSSAQEVQQVRGSRQVGQPKRLGRFSRFTVKRWGFELW